MPYIIGYKGWVVGFNLLQHRIDNTNECMLSYIPASLEILPLVLVGIMLLKGYVYEFTRMEI